jgi:hypothetical protein
MIGIIGMGTMAWVALGVSLPERPSQTVLDEQALAYYPPPCLCGRKGITPDGRRLCTRATAGRQWVADPGLY